MGLGEKIRKQVGRPRQANPLRELQALNDNLRGLGITLPEPDARHVRKSVGKIGPRRRSSRLPERLCAREAGPRSPRRGFPRQSPTAARCLASFGESFAGELSPEDFPMEEGAVRVNEDFTVDLFTLIRGRTFADFAATARRLEIDETVLRYLAPESLIDLKSTSERDKDRLDVVALREIIAGAALPGSANLEELTPPAGSTPEELR
jgi:hypothetical protein